MVGEEEAALRKALLASMRSLAEKMSSKKPSPSPSPLPQYRHLKEPVVANMCGQSERFDNFDEQRD